MAPVFPCYASENSLLRSRREFASKPLLQRRVFRRRRRRSAPILQNSLLIWTRDGFRFCPLSQPVSLAPSCRRLPKNPGTPRLSSRKPNRRPDLSYCFRLIAPTRVGHRIERGCAPLRRQGLCCVRQRGEVEGEGTPKRGDISVCPCCSHRTNGPNTTGRVSGMGSAGKRRRPSLRAVRWIGFRWDQAQVNPSAFRCSGQASGRPECSRSLAALRPGG
jgi:hypothetical protein